MLEIASTSVEYVRVPVAASAAGLPVDISGTTVEMAFAAGDAVPASGDWKTASWETDDTTTPPTYIARCLVGGTVTLTADTWAVWVRVTDNPETPVRRAGLLRVI